MSDSVFKTYTAILATAKAGENARKEAGEYKPGDVLWFAGNIKSLASKTGKSEITETRNIKKLLNSKWLVLIEDQRRVRYHGNFTSNKYRVVEDEEWLASNQPAAVKEPRKQNHGFRKMNLRRELKRLGVTFEGAAAEALLDMVAGQPLPDRGTECVPAVAHLVSPEKCDRGTSCVPAVAQPCVPADTQPCVPADTQPCATRFVAVDSSVCPPPPSEARWREFIHKMAPMMGVPTTDEKRQLRELAGREPYGLAFLAGAVEFEFQNRPKGTVGLRSMWATFLRENEDADYIRSAKTRLMANGTWRLANIRGERERQDASIERQTAELIARRDARPPDECCTVEDFLKEEQ